MNLANFEFSYFLNQVFDVAEGLLVGTAEEHAQVVAAGAVAGELMQGKAVPATDELVHLAVAVRR